MASGTDGPDTMSDSWLAQPTDVDDENMNLFQVVCSGLREHVIVQQIAMIAALPSDPAVVAKLGEHFNKYIFNLNKEDMQEQITGLLLVYPTCLLHIIESSRDMQLSFLKSVEEHHQSVFQETKVLFMLHNINRRLFHRWSHKTVKPEKPPKRITEEPPEDEDVDVLFNCIISALKQLSRQAHDMINPPSEDLNLILPPKVILKILKQKHFLSLQKHLQLYNSPMNIAVEISHVNTRSFNADFWSAPSKPKPRRSRRRTQEELQE